MAKLSYNATRGAVIEDRLFGAKIGMLDGPDNVDRFTNSMTYLGVKTVRIGDETHFDVSRPTVAVVDNRVANSAVVATNGTPDAAISIVESLTWAQQNNTPVVMSIPSRNLFVGTSSSSNFAPRAIDTAKVAEVKAFVKTLLTHNDTGPNALPDAPVSSIELGNEYWGAGLTSAEYGKLVNVLAVAVQQAMDELGLPAASQPKIIVQMGSPWGREFDTGGPYAGLSFAQKTAQANADILAQITNPLAKTAIDGLVEHYYHEEREDIFDNSAADLKFIETDWAQWSADGYGAKELHITEWNNKQDDPIGNNTQFGLKGAGVMVEQVENMLRMGVDAANVWPFQHNYSNLVDGLPSSSNAPPVVTPRGEVFRLMAESLPGTRLLESNLTTLAGQSYELNAFASRDQYVFFVTSRQATAQSINLDLSDVVTSYSGVAGVRVGFDPATADGGFYVGATWVVVPNYQDPDALALLTNLTGLGTAGSLNLTLGAYEIARLVFTVAQGQNLTGTAANETFTGGAGHDSILGGAGNDVLNAAQGDDTVFGGTGNDTINGGTGNNYINGEAGIDTLVYNSNAAITVNLSVTTAQQTGEGYHTIFGIENVTTGNGNDNVTGSSANNVIITGAGNDSISAGAGNDLVQSGAGNDVITYTAGADTVDGGTGIDTLIFSGISAVSISLYSVTNNLNMVVTNVENLTGGSGNDALAGDAQANLLTGNNGNDVLTGYAGNDTMIGGNGADSLSGLAGTDVLFGDAGNDTLQGGDAIDTLTGGLGNDQFRFVAITDGGDILTDFHNVTGDDDQILIKVSGFAAGLTAGALTAAKFWSSTTNAAHDADDRFIFRTTDKTLWFDANGNAAGGPILIADLQAGATLTYLDILLY